MDMRRIMMIVEGASQTDPLAFVENLLSACSAAKAGWYFEEGGCFAMAMALYEKLASHGAKIVVVYDGDQPTHAMVTIQDRFIDYTGWTTAWEGKKVAVTPEQLIEIADEAGCGDDFDVDKETAAEIIHNAETLDWSKWDWEENRWIVEGATQAVTESRSQRFCSTRYNRS